MESNETSSADRYGSVSNKKSEQDGSENHSSTSSTPTPPPSPCGDSARAQSHRTLGLYPLMCCSVHPSASGLICGKHPQIKFVKRPAPPSFSFYQCDRQRPLPTAHPKQRKSPSSSAQFVSTPPSRPPAPPIRSSSPRTAS